MSLFVTSNVRLKLWEEVVCCLAWKMLSRNLQKQQHVYLTFAEVLCAAVFK